MRRFDKKINIVKANLLAEERYLISKGIINENLSGEILPVGTKINFNGKNCEIIAHKSNINNEIFYLIRDENGNEEYVIPRDKRISNMNESFHMPDGTPIGVDHIHRPINKPLSNGDEIIWVGDVKTFGNGKIVKPGDTGKYIGRDENGFAVEFNKTFYASEIDFKKL